MGGRIVPEDFPALPGVRPSRVFQIFEKLDLNIVLYLMSCGICLASNAGLFAAQTRSEIAVMCTEIGLLYCRMVTSLNRSCFSLICDSEEIHSAIESYSINQAAQVQARQLYSVNHSLGLH